MLKSRVGWALPTEISFTKIRIGCLTHFIPTPIRWIIPIFHTPVKRWIRPISDAFYQSVLHRIKMDIIHVPPKIILITNHVFPKTPLPYRCFTVFPFWIGHPFVTVKQGRVGWALPTIINPTVLNSHCPSPPHWSFMVGGAYPTWLWNHQDFSPFVSNHRKEIGYTRYQYPSIIWHTRPFPIRAIFWWAMPTLHGL